MTETPTYSVIKKKDAIEIRDYPGYIQATVKVPETSYRGAIFKGFNLLADYIFGNNIKTEKISMTAPVQISQSQKIAMTKPVLVSQGGVYTISFVMPAQYTIETLPLPRNPAVTLATIDRHTMASINFKGFYRESQISKAKQRLSEWLEKEGFEVDGEFIIAGYNPPWVPSFLARSEVLVRIKEKGNSRILEE